MYFKKTCFVGLFAVSLLAVSSAPAAGIFSLFELAGRGIDSLVDDAKFRRVYRAELPKLDTDTKVRGARYQTFSEKFEELLELEPGSFRASKIQQLLNQSEDQALIDYVESKLFLRDPRFFPEEQKLPTAAEIMPEWRRQFYSATAGMPAIPEYPPQHFFWKAIHKRYPESLRDHRAQRRVFCLPETNQEFEDIFGYPPKEDSIAKLEERFRGYRDVRHKRGDNPKTKGDLKRAIEESNENGVVVIVGHNPNGIVDPVVTLGKDVVASVEEIESWALEANRSVVVVSCYSPHVAPTNRLRGGDITRILQEISMIQGKSHPQEYLDRVSRRCKKTILESARSKETRITLYVFSAGTLGVTGGGLMVLEDFLEYIEKREEKKAQP